MEFGCIFAGQRPQLHEQYRSGANNPNPVTRTDTEVFETILSGAELAEQLRFDSVWVTEHGFSEHSIISSPHSLLAAVAARTKRIRVAMGCTIVPWYHPLRIAQDLATVDIISGGRLDVGVGRGAFKRKFDAYGIDMSESRKRFQEGMDIVTRAWTEERFAYEGNFYTIPEVTVLPKPAQKPHPPIWVPVSHSPESLEYAVRHRWSVLTQGNTFFPTSPSEDILPATLYHRMLVESGVAPEDIKISASRFLFVAETDEKAISMIRPRLEWSADMLSFITARLASMRDRPESYEDYKRHTQTDPLVREQEVRGAIGSPEKVVATLRQLESQNVTHFLGFVDVGGLPYPEIEKSLVLFAEEVMPEFRRFSEREEKSVAASIKTVTAG